MLIKGEQHHHGFMGKSMQVKRSSQLVDVQLGVELCNGQKDAVGSIYKQL